MNRRSQAEEAKAELAKKIEGLRGRSSVSLCQDASCGSSAGTAMHVPVWLGSRCAECVQSPQH